MCIGHNLSIQGKRSQDLREAKAVYCGMTVSGNAPLPFLLDNMLENCFRVVSRYRNEVAGMGPNK